MLAGGLYLFLVLWFIYDDLIAISSNPHSFEGGKYLFLVLGLGKLFDLATGINNSILGYSPSYRVNFLFILVLGVSNIILNYFLIREYGIVGAAYSTFIAYLLFNVLKFLYLAFRYRITPFSKRLLYLVLLGIFTYFILQFISFRALYLNLFGKPLIISALFWAGIVYFDISPEFKGACRDLYSKFFKKK